MTTQFPSAAQYAQVYGPTQRLSHLIGKQSIDSPQIQYHTNPACQADRVACFPEASQQDWLQALAVAAAAQSDWASQTGYQRWKAVSHPLRSFWGSAYKQDQRLTWCRLRSRESGLPRSIAFDESDRMMRALVHPRVGRPHTEALPSTGQPVCWIQSQSHHPLVQALDTVLQALFRGQSVIWQPAPNHATSAYLIVQQAQAHLPAGVLNLVHSSLGPDIPSWMAQAAALAQRISCQPDQTLQPFVLAPDISPRFLSEILSRCLSPNAVEQRYQGIAVPTRGFERFCQALPQILAQVRTGDPSLSDRLDYGPLSNQVALQHYKAFFLQIKQAQGGQLHYGKGRMSRDNKPSDFIGDPDLGNYVWPLIWQPDDPAQPLPEVPGPVLAVWPV